MLCGLSSCFSDTEQGSPGSFRSTLLLRNVSAKCGDRWQPFGTLVGADGRHWVWVAGGWVQGQLSVHGKGDSPVECRFLRVAGQSILETIGDDARVPFPWHLKLQCLDIVAVFLLGVPSAVCTRQPPTESMLGRFHLPAWSSVRGCSAYGPGLIFPRSACLRLILFCKCPPLCVGALWPMPAWVCHDVRSVFFSFLNIEDVDVEVQCERMIRVDKIKTKISRF